MIQIPDNDFFVFVGIAFFLGCLTGYAIHLVRTTRRMEKQIAVQEDISAQVEREDTWFEEMHARAHEKLRGHSESALQPERNDFRSEYALPSEFEKDEIYVCNIEPNPKTKTTDDGITY